MTIPLTLTIEEAAKLLGVSRGVGYEAARRGELPTIRLGRRLLVPKIALERMLGIEDERPEAASPGARETSTVARQEGDRVPAG
jgi:excisionase family DNA binding protein